jgi:peptidoglycan/LPS O-acetylase OafA/YrhL
VATFSFACVKYFWLGNESDNAISHYLQYSQQQDFWPFVGGTINFIIRNITLVVTTDYFTFVDYTSGYLLVQQAWTLQIEVLFYLMSPFLVSLNKKYFS